MKRIKGEFKDGEDTTIFFLGIGKNLWKELDKDIPLYGFHLYRVESDIHALFFDHNFNDEYMYLLKERYTFLSDRINSLEDIREYNDLYIKAIEFLIEKYGVEEYEGVE